MGPAMTEREVSEDTLHKPTACTHFSILKHNGQAHKHIKQGINASRIHDARFYECHLQSGNKLTGKFHEISYLASTAQVATAAGFEEKHAD